MKKKKEKIKVIDTGLKALALAKKFGYGFGFNEQNKYSDTAYYYGRKTRPENSNELRKELRRIGFKRNEKYAYIYTNKEDVCFSFFKDGSIRVYGPKRAVSNPLPHYW